MTLTATETIQVKLAPPVEGVLPLFHARWSPRSFAQKPVSEADLARLFEAARWTASAFNEQPWRFLAGVQKSEAWQKIFSTLMPANQAWAKQAPVLILAVAKTTFTHNGAANGTALYDLGGAVTALQLEAAHLGLGTHQMSGFDHAAARAAFGLPEGYEPVAVVAVGYQGEPEALENEMQREKEQAPRQRKGLSEIAWSAWESPLGL